MAGETWICCDSCSKWRRIKQALADSLDEETPWHCSDNPDPVYNSCDVPQELTDVEIDERTQLPVMEEAPEEGEGGGGSGSDDDGGGSPREVSLRAGKLRKRPPVWQLISQNIYMHRERKSQDEDDVMVCQCKPIWATDATTVGCGEHCLNRMLNIECVAKFCPCGERCTNRAFSARAYAALEVRRAGAKGFGLFAAQDVKAGQFIVEYVGEVLEEEEYARRKEFYIATGQRHYYFMNVGNGEVIDAARRGGLGRFINHSCEPNCETQKWVVRGELAIGLFALEDVAAGAELTFDYNFERYGDKPMKCLCASPACRGVIGGAQETAARLRDTIVAPEEAEPDPEPIMVTEREADAAVAAILDRAVGLGWEKGFEPALQRRLEKLAAAKGVAMPVAPPGGAGERSDGEPEGDSDEEIAAAAAAAKVASAAKARAVGKKSRAPRAPRAREADPDWGEAAAPAAAAAPVAAPRPRAKAAPDSERATPARATPLIPKRAGSLATPGSRGGAAAAVAPLRRSEVDRRLDELVGASGRLKDSTPRTVLSLLRLFNLCDIGPTVEKAAGSRAGGGRGGAATGTTTATGTGTATRLEVGSNRPGEREEGEVSGQSGGSGGAAAAAAAPAERGGARGKEGVVTARQRARLADMSLLLDAISRSCSNPPTRKQLLASGALQQLLAAVGRHDLRAPPYYVILRKALLAVEELQPSAETAHTARTAHGTFADFVKSLTVLNDYGVRNQAWALHKKWLPGAGAPGGGRHAVLESSAASVRTPQAAGLGAAPGASPGGWDRGGGGRTGPADFPSPHGPPPAGGRGPGPSRFGREREALPPRADWERGLDYGGREPRDREGPPDWERERQRGGGGGGGGGDRDRGRSPDRKRSRWDGPEAERPAAWGNYGPPGGAPPPGGRGGLPPLPPPEDFPPPPKHHREMRPNRSGAHLADAGGYGDRGGWEPEAPPGGWAPPPGEGPGGWGAPPPPVGDGYGPPPHSFSRPHSAVFSEGSRGSGGAGGAPPPPPPPPAAAAANGAPELSPMTDEEDAPNGAPNGAAAPPSPPAAHDDDDDDDFVVRIDLPKAASPAQAPVEAPDGQLRAAEESPAGDEGWEPSWEAPGERFSAYVAHVVQKRVAKYEQGEHPTRLARDDAARLFKEIFKDITEKEAAAYRERRRRGQPKPIERRKLEARIKDYVRDKVKRHWAARGGG